MSRSPLYTYMIGAGYNLPLGSLTNVETIRDANGIYLYPPQSYGLYLPGSPATRGNGIEFQRGYPSTDWRWTGAADNGYITYAGAYALRAGYFGTLWSNSLTIYTPTDRSGNYARFNAIGTIKKLPDSGANFKILTKFSVKLTRLVAL